MKFGEYFFWSPILGVDAVRLSLWDQHGQEFWKVLACPSGRGYRALRQKTLSLLADAIDDGRAPGEVS